MSGTDYEMDTDFTFNPDLSKLEQVYSQNHYKLSDWRLKGYYQY